ncbi:MAG: DNA repair protein RecO [Rickettsiales bacterium]|nr:DNA repair protein RecO [Rickettsiales bacterium]
MQWTDRALILSVRKYSEHAGIIRLYSREHGLYGGMARAAFTRKQRGTFQPGNLVEATWKARLAEHMGSLQCDLEQPVAALVMQDALSLAAVSTVCGLLADTQNEREAHPELYDRAEALVKHIAAGHAWLPYYIKFELDILITSGFGLDLDVCAASGRKDELIYVSPRSGRAVCAEEGAPYKDKLLGLPVFIRERVPAEEVSAVDIEAGLRLSGYFLDKWVYMPHAKRLPATRDTLVRHSHQAVNAA